MTSETIRFVYEYWNKISNDFESNRLQSTLSKRNELSTLGVMMSLVVYR